MLKGFNRSKVDLVDPFPLKTWQFSFLFIFFFSFILYFPFQSSWGAHLLGLPNEFTAMSQIEELRFRFWYDEYDNVIHFANSLTRKPTKTKNSSEGGPQCGNAPVSLSGVMIHLKYPSLHLYP